LSERCGAALKDGWVLASAEGEERRVNELEYNQLVGKSRMATGT